ncbi:hypothetical protein TraAM80_04683 [Trypanosoma rangeli]|uniref:Surface protease GP63 n=1 Tax=Trypanosoma rangeli TaxID=5698 RepID=A0A3R7LXF4_TRYRA|nr:uncharacterized protein TraAM80_04683 [Trypanosoma rangeli]RNF05209.1 hypothetical protein TraAM80_04683 [Trypanosoma rangeli]|eukprot:RNF05209.1 hypothetical protein TraAM80_04683 [Trypanosoma rangeli]
MGLFWRALCLLLLLLCSTHCSSAEERGQPVGGRPLNAPGLELKLPTREDLEGAAAAARSLAENAGEKVKEAADKATTEAKSRTHSPDSAPAALALFSSPLQLAAALALALTITV